jgi:putative FmdB family regulatory protein
MRASATGPTPCAFGPGRRSIPSRGRARCLRYTQRSMPTYEYVCKNCGHLFEIVQSMKDDPLTECPECAGELRKVFAPPAISFKGSGFYATDHGKKSKQPADKSSGSGEKSDKSDAKKSSSGDSGSGSGSSSGSSDSAGSSSKDTSGSSSKKDGSSGSKEKPSS